MGYEKSINDGCNFFAAIEYFVLVYKV